MQQSGKSVKKMKAIRNENTYHVYGWMINLLKLSGLQLDLFAIIYGFSQDGESEFFGSLSYMQAFCNASKNGILNALRSLENKGLISKRYVMENNVRRAKYRACLMFIDKVRSEGFVPVNFGKKDGETGSSVCEQGVVQKVNRGGSVSAPGVVHFVNPIVNRDTIRDSKESKKESLIYSDMSFAEFDEKYSCLDSDLYREKRSKYLSLCSFDNLLEYGISITKYIFDKTDSEDEVRLLLKKWLKSLKSSGTPMTNAFIVENLEVLADKVSDSSLSVEEYLREVLRHGWTAFNVVRAAGKDYFEIMKKGGNGK